MLYKLAYNLPVFMAILTLATMIVHVDGSLIRLTLIGPLVWLNILDVSTALEWVNWHLL